MLLRLLVVAPFRLYCWVEDKGGAIPWSHVGMATVLAALGALAGLAVATPDRDPLDAAVRGVLVVILGLFGWVIYSGLVVFAQWVRGVDKEHYAGD